MLIFTSVAGKRGEFPFLGGPGKREALDEEDKRALFDLVQGLTDTVGQTLEGVPVLGGLASGVVKTAGGLGSATGAGSSILKRALLDLAQGLKESVGQTLEGVPVVGGIASGVVKTAGGLGGATGTGSGLLKRNLADKVSGIVASLEVPSLEL
ncbi:uncharacterized protein LOC106079133 [Biomphalaria glabrata]|uniref:Uncharacterized protein LOC106079133 n=1 Tax=Biomphalaria glabrata TaxID=6526 RepID=A0A9W2YWE2_BIOGL|nr:uncharacterized protein LOC106079133 [Biomphalaria glabrata]